MPVRSCSRFCSGTRTGSSGYGDPGTRSRNAAIHVSGSAACFSDPGNGNSRCSGACFYPRGCTGTRSRNTGRYRSIRRVSANSEGCRQESR